MTDDTWEKARHLAEDPKKTTEDVAKKRMFVSFLPRPSRLTQRRFLLLKDLVSWVDDDFTCDKVYDQGYKHHCIEVEGELGRAVNFHRYCDTAGRQWLARCPRSLTATEKLSVGVDIPPGVVRSAIAIRRAELAAMPRRRSYDDRSE